MSLPDGDGVAHLRLLAVGERHRRKGVARTLLATALRDARSLGAPVAETATQGRNSPSMAMHLAAGFTVTRRRVWFHRWYAS